MDKRYNHKEFEERLYKQWEEIGAFAPSEDEKAETFTIMMPPPNANDPLHIGHAMFVTVEDILIRYHRMLGKATLWLPGTDHAGIETQFVFEKKLAKQKQSRFDFDRETLYQKIWDYVQDNSDVAVSQLKALGASADWSRFKFMLDEDIVSTVLNTFQHLHDQNLVYRDLKLVNYCTYCGTAFSELEVVHKDQQTPLYYIRYRKADNPNEYIVIATTRPEPIFADTHIAVHPDNPKTKDLIGTQVLNPLTDEVMTIIADEFVDPEFGTGIVKLTPAHDHNDFEVAQRHDLPMNQAINTYGKIVEAGGKFAGLNVKKAREAVVAELEQKDLLEKVDDKYHNRVSSCYRCGRTIEPLPMPQFFIKVKPLVEPVLSGLENKEIRVHGAGHDKILKHWLENLRDWNISRQIVWGIQLPVWYEIADSKEQRTKSKNGEIEITLKIGDETIRGGVNDLLEKYSLEKIRSGLQSLRAPMGAKFVISPTPPGENYLQETDTFDTWFSSSQWPFSTLKNTQPGDFDRFYPTQVMETGYDILPFWVMRMLMMGKFATGEFPFNDVYLHGLIRDAKGQKMSKSKGNVINPLSVIDTYGADALRMALVIRSTPGQDKNVGEQDIRAMRNLTNKIWNAARFIQMNLEGDEGGKQDMGSGELDGEFDKKLNSVVASVSKQLDEFRIGLAAETAYNEFWHWFCDEGIEQAKEGKVSYKTLIGGLVDMLTLMHPFVPFVTEAVYQELRSNKQVIMLSGEKLNQEMLIGINWPNPSD